MHYRWSIEHLDPLQIAQLFEGKPVASLATLGRDGFPHVVPMWAREYDGLIYMPTSSSTIKVENLERDDRAALMIHHRGHPMELTGVLFQGRASILRGEEALRRNEEIHRSYLTESELADPGTKAYLSGDDVTIVLVPESTRSWDLSATVGF